MSSVGGKRVLVTGAARGIGAAVAERLASQGARLALVGLERDQLAAVAERCGEGTFTSECDVSDREQITRAIDDAAEALGGLDVVVANAGIAAAGPLRLQEIRSWERVIEINLLGVMYTDRAALPHLERSRGYLLNIASAAAVAHGPGMSAYCAAKAGVEALTNCLRVEEAPVRRRRRRCLLPVPGHRHGPGRGTGDATDGSRPVTSSAGLRADLSAATGRR